MYYSRHHYFSCIIYLFRYREAKEADKRLIYVISFAETVVQFLRAVCLVLLRSKRKSTDNIFPLWLLKSELVQFIKTKKQINKIWVSDKRYTSCYRCITLNVSFMIYRLRELHYIYVQCHWFISSKIWEINVLHLEKKIIA